MVRIYSDNGYDVYCIKEPSDLHDRTSMHVTVKCVHISEELKTKNLYNYFDDQNGIDTCSKLIRKAIAGTGWKIGLCDTFLESDGITERVRSYSCDPKTGAYNMVVGICSLFNARPVFHGDTKEIDIFAVTKTDGWMEILFGKNADKIQRVTNSDNLITRLYVEGEYGDFGYVGIDDVNPTGLPFILNFDYYKQLGLFTAEHQRIVDQYLIDYKQATDAISSNMERVLDLQGKLNELMGSHGYVYYPVTSGAIDESGKISGNSISTSNEGLSRGDLVAVVSTNGSYDYEEYPPSLLTNKIAVIKFVPTITGMMAAYEDIESAAANNISAYLEKLNTYLEKNGYEHVTVSGLKSAYGVSDLTTIKNETFDASELPVQYQKATVLDYAYDIGKEESRSTEATAKKNAGMLEIISYIIDIESETVSAETSSTNQVEIEANFNAAMGSMLRDGYWSDNNYTVGQEEFLYSDALAISKKMAFPIASYTVGVQNLSRLSKYKDEEIDLAYTIRMYDPDMKINDFGVVSKIIESPDSPQSDSVEINTDVLDVGNKSFASILERVTEMAEKIRQNKEIYHRAVAITKDGKFKSDFLEGAIDVLKTKLLSTSSNWKTDDNGNIIMESLDGTSAMMLCGSGFMCANTKTDGGAWNWRTFGTGDGFTADMIVAGYLNAARIEAGTITVDHLAPNVGSDLDLATNTSINLLDGKISMIVSGDSSESELILTEEAIQAISKNIDITANEEIKLKIEGIEESISEVGLTADKIHWLIGQNAEDASSMTLTQDAIEAMSDSIVLTAEKINEVADEIDLDGNTTIQQMRSEIKIVSDSITSQVSTKEFNEATGVIESTISNIVQRADEIELSIEKKVDEETLRGYIRYDGSVVEIGKTDSRYMTQTSDTGFVILQDGSVMTSMVKNTVSAPVMEAKRQFQIGKHVIKMGSGGELLFM